MATTRHATRALWLSMVLLVGCSTDSDAEYTEDLRRICHVHEITGKPIDEGLLAVAPWLSNNVRTRAARQRLSELPNADVIEWLQRLRRDAAARGISPCPFSDAWEAFLKQPSP